MNTIYGLFPNEESALHAASTLRTKSSELHIKPESITVISSQPIEEEITASGQRHSWMPWIAVAGGILGGTGGYSLAAFTQRTYPLPTGGMPIVALWPTGIVMYELTMLGAILATVVTLVITARLPRYKNRIYDPAVSHGKVLVALVDPSCDEQEKLRQSLGQLGAEQVQQTPQT
jgi:Protein of unknown function (DUF3341)